MFGFCRPPRGVLVGERGPDGTGLAETRPRPVVPRLHRRRPPRQSALVGYVNGFPGHPRLANVYLDTELYRH